MDIHLICTIKNNRTVLTPEDKLRLFCRMLALDNTFLTLQTVLEQAMLWVATTITKSRTSTSVK